MHSSLKSFKAFIGLDWADKKHDICLQSSGSDKRIFSKLQHNPKAIEEWALELHKIYQGPIAIALELSQGPIVSALQKYDFFVIYPINPCTLAKYRNAFQPSRAKDDPTDAELAMDLMLRYPERFKPLSPQSDTIRQLMYLVEQRRKFVEDKTRFKNRLIDTLKQYYPQLIEWFTHRDSEVFCSLIERWPNIQALKRARLTTIKSFLHAHNCRFPKRIEYILNQIKETIPLTEDKAIIMAHQLNAIALVQQIRATKDGIAQFEEAIETLTAQHPDYPIFESLPGAGECLTPRLLVAFGEQRERFDNAQQVQQYSGIAPVLERSGQKNWVHWRWQCSKFLRQSFIEWAAKTITRSYWAGLYYHRKVASGATHQVAVRALAFKWIRIVFSCWKNRKLYNEVTYLNSLKERGSPLLNE